MVRNALSQPAGCEERGQCDCLSNVHDAPYDLDAGSGRAEARVERVCPDQLLKLTLKLADPGE